MLGNDWISNWGMIGFRIGELLDFVLWNDWIMCCGMIGLCVGELLGSVVELLDFVLGE